MVVESEVEANGDAASVAPLLAGNKELPTAPPKEGGGAPKDVVFAVVAVLALNEDPPPPKGGGLELSALVLAKGLLMDPKT